MLETDLATPGTVEEAVSILAETDGARPIAGGTDLLVHLRRGGAPPPLLVSLHRVEGLDAIALESGVLRLGAGVTLAALTRDPTVRRAAPLLAETAAEMASPHVRSRATVGGNLCNASPAADLAPPLLVHEARAVLAGPGGERTLPIAELLVGPGATALRAAELLVALEVPLLPEGWTGTAIKHQAGRCADLSIVSVTAAVRLDDRGRCAGARIALGAVAPTAIRVPEVEALLAGRPLDAETRSAAGRRASELCCPIDDVRASCDHRCHLVAVLLAEALERCAHPTPSRGGER